jgi:SOS-response transcriptional repressor LexA
MSMGITPKQHRLLRFIRAYTAERGCSPSYIEMMHAMKLSSTSGVYRLVHALIERGRISASFTWEGNVGERSLEVVDEPIFIHGRRFKFIPKVRAVSPFGADKTGGALANSVPGRLFEGAR